jgi:protein involved in polysaccharide export with SLBB domain
MNRTRVSAAPHLRARAATLLCASLLLLLGSPADGQSPRNWNPQALLTTRGDLERQLETVEAAATSSAYSAALRRQAARDAELIRNRLETGDFQTGDQVILTVGGEAGLSNTFVVTTEREILLPDIGPISLAGVLRAELTEHLRTELARYVRDPDIRAYTMLRVMVMGEVNNPGFLVVPSEALITDVLSLAGGPTRTAALDEIRVERSGQVIAVAETLQAGIIGGLTIDQLNLQAGDRLVIPQVRVAGTGLWSNLRWALTAIPPAVFLILRLRRL